MAERPHVAERVTLFKRLKCPAQPIQPRKYELEVV
jgi:hypothetical protein